MAVSISCPSCHRAYQIAEGTLGAMAKCGNCGHRFTLSMAVEDTAGPTGPRASQVAAEASRPPHEVGESWEGSLSQPGRLAAGDRLGQCVIKHRLGGGAMGEVWLAHDPTLERDVAIKVLPSDFANDQERLSRFMREARLAAKVQHPNTVTIYHAGVDRGLAYLAMEYVDGGSLDQAVAPGRPIAWREATRIVRDAAAALEAAHQLGLVHRDVKPSNLMRNSKGVTKMVDFGLARALQGGTQLTHQGTLLGTPAYMAPELWQGRDADAGSDRYGLICTYYHLLTGHLPYDAPSIPALGYQHRYEPLPDPREFVPGIPDAVCRILLRGAEKDPSMRHQSAAELIGELEAALSCPQGSLTFGSPWPKGSTAEAGRGDQRAPVGVVGRARRGLTVVGRTLRAWRTGLPPRFLLTALGGASAVILAVVIYIKADRGTVEVEVEQASGTVQITVDPPPPAPIPEKPPGPMPTPEPAPAPAPKPEPKPEPEPKPSQPGPATDPVAAPSAELARLQEEVNQAKSLRPDDPRASALRERMVAFRQTCQGTPDRLRAAALMGQVPWPLDGLNSQQIAEQDLAAAGGGDPKQAPAQLVAVFGDSRLKHWGTVVDFEFSRDGKLLATASSDSTVKLWDAATWKHLATLPVRHPLVSMDFSADGKTLATSTRERRELAFWSVPAGKAAPLLDSEGGATALGPAAFSPDGKLLATAGPDKTVRVWDITTRKQRHALSAPGQKGDVSAVEFSPDSRVLVAGSNDSIVKGWEIASGKELFTLDFVRPGRWFAEIHALRFSPDGRALGVACNDLALVDVGAGEIKWLKRPNFWGVFDLSFSADGDLIASTGGAGDPNYVQITDVSSGEVRRSIRDWRGASPVSFSPDGRLLAASGAEAGREGNKDNTVRFWDVTNWQEKRPPERHVGVVFSVACSPDGRWLASASADTTVKIWDLATGKLSRSLEDHTLGVPSVAFSPDGKTLASAGYDRTVKLWDVASGQIRKALTDHPCAIRSAAFSPDGKTLAVCGGSESPSGGQAMLRLWDLAKHTWRDLGGHKAQLRCVAFGPDGKILASAGDDKTVQVWNTATAEPVHTLTGHNKGVYAAAFSPDGAKLVSTDAEGTMRLWDVATGWQRASLQEHKRAVYSVSFSPDGTVMATSAADGTVRLWDASSNQPIDTLTIAPEGGEIRQVAFTPDGRHVATANGNGTAYLLRLDKAIAKTPVSGVADPILPGQLKQLEERVFPSLVYVTAAGDNRAPLGVVTSLGVCTVMPGSFQNVELVTLDGKRRIAGRVASRSPFPFCWIDVDENDLPEIAIAEDGSDRKPQDAFLALFRDGAAKLHAGKIEANGVFSMSTEYAPQQRGVVAPGPVFSADGTCLGFSLRSDRDMPIVIYPLKRD